MMKKLEEEKEEGRVLRWFLKEGNGIKGKFRLSRGLKLLNSSSLLISLEKSTRLILGKTPPCAIVTPGSNFPSSSLFLIANNYSRLQIYRWGRKRRRLFRVSGEWEVREIGSEREREKGGKWRKREKYEPEACVCVLNGNENLN